MPIFNSITLAQLLGSIETGNLVVLCGAGLSIPAPSHLMSALRVSRHCYDQWLPVEQLPAGMRDNVDILASHFYDNGTFKSIFVRRLVPWDDLVGEPNSGHAALADLLICRAVHAVLSANFDPLIEQWSERRKIAMQGALSGAEAIEFTARTNPLLKFHGCLHRGRSDTLWTQGQLAEVDVQARVASCSQWMNLNLPGKDLLVVGFWTDWGYLNDVLQGSFTVQNAASVTVVDISPEADLQVKAPILWNKLTNAGGPFTFVQASGADALEELRREFSKVWAKKFFQLAAPFVEESGGAYNPASMTPANWTCDDLYDLRRDIEGVPYDRAAKRKEPQPEGAAAAYVHVLLTEAGAAREGAMYIHGGQKVRIVHAAGQSVESVRQKYNEPPTLASPDVIVCAGAQALGTPGSVIATGKGASVVRPARGGAANWLTLEEARARLGL